MSTKLVACLLLVTGCSLATIPEFRPVFGSGDSPCRQLARSSTEDFLAGAISAALVGAFVRSPNSEGPDLGGAFAVLVLAPVAVLDGASGLVGLYEHHECVRVERAFEEAELAAAAAEDDDREEAWKLTQEAEAAARAGDCARVFELAHRVEKLYKDMRDSVLGRDVAVARCLAGTGHAP